MFHCIFLENASSASSASKNFRCFDSPSIEICILLFPWLSNKYIKKRLLELIESIWDFLFHFIETSYRVSALDSLDEKEDVISTAATTNNHNQRKDSASFTEKGLPISSAT